MDDASAEQLRAMPYFRDLPDLEASSFVKNAHSVSFRARERILTAGEPIPGFYLVLSGRVRVFRVGRDGREQTLRIVGPGETFAEVPIFLDGLAPAWVESLQRSNLALIPLAEFRRLLEQHPQVALTLARQFAGMIKHLTERVEQMGLQTVQARICQYLNQLAAEEGLPHEGGVVVPRELTQQDLATVVGSVREVVGRTLKSLQQDGVIRMERQRVVILDMERLSQLL